MEILIIIFLLTLTGISIWLFYKTLKWFFKRKTRFFWLSSLLVIGILGYTINQLFFIKMEFIQSNVYPNLYLVKNEIKNRDSLNNTIRKKVIKQINDDFITNGKRYTENTHKAPYATLAFYSYSKSSRLSVFQDYGTAYFIDHKEDLGGFSVEDLSMYQNEKLATFNIRLYKNDSTQYYGVLEYYEKGYPVKTDTLELQKK